MAIPPLVAAALRLPPVELTQVKKAGRRLRGAMALESVDWPRGADQRHEDDVGVYEEGGWSIGFGKPGKEAFRKRKPKPDDMTPRLRRRDASSPYQPAFGHIFGELRAIGQQSRDALTVVGTLIYRMAFVLDHQERSPGHTRYAPAQSVMDWLGTEVPSVTEHQLPLRVWLGMLDAIGLNEDVKYSERSGSPTRIRVTDVGRENTCLTTAHVVAYNSESSPQSPSSPACALLEESARFRLTSR